MSLPGIEGIPAKITPDGVIFPTLDALNLLDGCQLVLDAASSVSFDGAEYWEDLIAGQRFIRGASAASGEATDPTFTGTIGAAGSYMSTDGGDFFEYENGLEAWMADFGKRNTQISILSVSRTSVDTSVPFIANGTQTPDGDGYGFGYGFSGVNNKISGRVGLDESNSNGLIFVGGAVNTPLNTVVVNGASWDFTATASYWANQNGTTGGPNSLSTYQARLNTTPGAGPMRIFRNGATSYAANGTRLYGIAMWLGRCLTPTELASIWTNIRGSYGL